MICTTTDGHWARLRDREHRSGVWRSDPTYASQSACPPHCRVMRAGSREPPCPWRAASWLGKRTRWTDTLLGVTCQEEGKDSCVCDWCVGVVSKYACLREYEGIQALLRVRLVSCKGPDGRREGDELDSRVFGESDKSDKISLELKLCCQHVLSWPAFCPPLSPVNPPPLSPAQGLAHTHLMEQIWRHVMVSESFS